MTVVARRSAECPDLCERDACSISQDGQCSASAASSCVLASAASTGELDSALHSWLHLWLHWLGEEFPAGRSPRISAGIPCLHWPYPFLPSWAVCPFPALLSLWSISMSSAIPAMATVFLLWPCPAWTDLAAFCATGQAPLPVFPLARCLKTWTYLLIWMRINQLTFLKWIEMAMFLIIDAINLY